MSSDNKETQTTHRSPFEAIRRESEEYGEFWSARDLARILDYALWQKFRNVIEKAKKACANSSQVVLDHFIRLDKMVSLGSGAQRKIDDYYLSRYACYLIVRMQIRQKRLWLSGKPILQSRRVVRKRLMLLQVYQKINGDFSYADSSRCIIDN